MCVLHLGRFVFVKFLCFTKLYLFCRSFFVRKASSTSSDGGVACNDSNQKSNAASVSKEKEKTAAPKKEAKKFVRYCFTIPNFSYRFAFIVGNSS